MDRKLFGHGRNCGVPIKDPAGKNAPIARRLRAIMVAERLPNQDAFADRIGAEKKRLNNALVGYPLSIDVAHRIRRAVPGITRDWLYDGDETGLPVSLRDRLREAETTLKTGANGRS
jgi:hypothetical protein